MAPPLDAAHCRGSMQLKPVGHADEVGVGEAGETLGVAKTHSTEQLPVRHVHSVDVCWAGIDFGVQIYGGGVGIIIGVVVGVGGLVGAAVAVCVGVTDGEVVITGSGVCVGWGGVVGFVDDA